MTVVRILLVLLLAAALGAGVAQSCVAELQGREDAAALSQPATGRDAAVYLKRAVDLLEPALPPLIQVRGGPLPETDPLYDTIQFLAERKLLPMGWEPDTLTAETWSTMIGAFADWYDVTLPEAPEAALTRGELVDDLGGLIARVAPQLQPVAVIASADEDEGHIAFWSVIRNHGPYPRMVVVRPPSGELSLAEGVGEVLPALSNCALAVTDYVFTSAATAQRLFLSTSEAQMVVVQRDPPGGEALEYVPSGSEPAYFTFDDPSLAGVARYAALFVGPSVPLMTILRIIPQLRTNMSPREILNFVSAP